MARVLTPYRIQPSYLSAEVGSTVELEPLAQARDTHGKDEPVTTLKWRIDSGAGGGRIGADSGRLVVRSTPGEMVIRGTGAGSDYCLVVVTAIEADTGQPEPPDDVEPPDPAPLPAVKPVMFLYGEEPDDADFGDLWTCSVEVVNNDLVRKINVAKAKGGKIIGSQGTYSLYQRKVAGGRMEYDRNLYSARVDSHRPYAAKLRELFEAGAYLGHQACDDWAGLGQDGRWKWPGSWTIERVIDELSWMAGKWRAVVPGVPVWLRARARQFTTKLPRGYNGMVIQYRYWGLGGETPVAFRKAEEVLCKARAWRALWSCNFLNGGRNVGGDKAPMTPAQIRECGEAFSDGDKDVSVGFGGWMKDDLLDQAAYVSAFKDVKAMFGA